MDTSLNYEMKETHKQMSVTLKNNYHDRECKGRGIHLIYIQHGGYITYVHE